MSAFGTNTFMENGFVNGSSYTAFNTSAAEGSLLAGVNEQPVLPPNFFVVPSGLRRRLIIECGGILGSTGAPTLILRVLLSQSSGSTITSASANTTTVGRTTTITTSGNASPVRFYLRHCLTVTTPGFGSTSNCTLSGTGFAECMGNFAAPYRYNMSPGGGESATITSTINGAVQHYVHVTATWSASSASNTIQVLAGEFIVRGEN